MNANPCQKFSKFFACLIGWCTKMLSLPLLLPKLRSVSIECCYQNTSIAIASGLAFFKTEEEVRNALGVPFFYTGMQSLVVGLFALTSWKIGWTKCPRDENIVKMILGNYQEDDKENEDDHHDSSGIALGNNMKGNIETNNGDGSGIRSDNDKLHQAETGVENGTSLESENKLHSGIYS